MGGPSGRVTLVDYVISDAGLSSPLAAYNTHVAQRQTSRYRARAIHPPDIRFTNAVNYHTVCCVQERILNEIDVAWSDFYKCAFLYARYSLQLFTDCAEVEKTLEHRTVPRISG